MLLPEKTAAQVRTQAATILVRFLGGDLGLLQDVTKMHNVQTFPREVDPANWRASFGEAVAQCKAPVPQVFDEAKECANTAASHLYTLAPACMADVCKVGRSEGPVERCRFTQKTPRQVGRFTRGVLSRAAFRAACQIYRGGTRGFDRFPHRSVAPGTCCHPCARSLSDLHRKHLQLVKKKTLIRR